MCDRVATHSAGIAAFAGARWHYSPKLFRAYVCKKLSAPRWFSRVSSSYHTPAPRSTERSTSATLNPDWIAFVRQCPTQETVVPDRKPQWFQWEISSTKNKKRKADTERAEWDWMPLIILMDDVDDAARPWDWAASCIYLMRGAINWVSMWNIFLHLWFSAGQLNIIIPTT